MIHGSPAVPGSSASSKEQAQESSGGPRWTDAATSLATGYPGEHLLNVLTASLVGGFAAGLAGRTSAHVGFSVPRLMGATGSAAGRLGAR